MHPEEIELRRTLTALAAAEGGGRLLQLGLRSLESGERELVAGCWTRRGDAGCLFQHAYWEGVGAGLFGREGHARAWVSSVAGPDGYHRVIDSIAAFDRLARTHYAVSRPRFGPPKLDQPRWRAAVAAILIDVLDAGRSSPAASATVTTAG